MTFKSCYGTGSISSRSSSRRALVMARTPYFCASVTSEEAGVGIPLERPTDRFAGSHGQLSTSRLTNSFEEKVTNAKPLNVRLNSTSTSEGGVSLTSWIASKGQSFLLLSSDQTKR